MTDEDRERISEYMGWQKYPPECMGETVFYRDEIHGDIRWDLNAAALCIQEMQKRGDWEDFMAKVYGVCHFHKISSATAWLFNLYKDYSFENFMGNNALAENFFNAMSEWLKERGK